MTSWAEWKISNHLMADWCHAYKIHHVFREVWWDLVRSSTTLSTALQTSAANWIGRRLFGMYLGSNGHFYAGKFHEKTPYNWQFAPQNRSSKRKLVFQPSIFRCKLTVSFREAFFLPLSFRQKEVGLVKILRKPSCLRSHPRRCEAV